MSKRSVQERKPGEDSVLDEIGASEFGIEKIGRESSSHAGFGHITQSGEL